MRSADVLSEAACQIDRLTTRVRSGETLSSDDAESIRQVLASCFRLRTAELRQEVWAERQTAEDGGERI